MLLKVEPNFWQGKIFSALGKHIPLLSSSKARSFDLSR